MYGTRRNSAVKQVKRERGKLRANFSNGFPLTRLKAFVPTFSFNLFFPYPLASISASKAVSCQQPKVLPFLHVALTTQLYFKGDPHLAGDPWGGHKPSLALDLKQDGRYMVSNFDFVLGTGL